MNKNDSLGCPTLGRVNCAEMEFQALVCFQDFFYCYFKGINLLKNRELAFHSLNWTINSLMYLDLHLIPGFLLGHNLEAAISQAI